MIKSDAFELLLYIANGGNGLRYQQQYPDRIHPNRIHALCEKWTRRGYMDYGVSPRTGWLTKKGKEWVRQLKAEMEMMPGSKIQVYTVDGTCIGEGHLVDARVVYTSTIPVEPINRPPENISLMYVLHDERLN